MLEALKAFYQPIPITRNLPQWDMFTQQVAAKRCSLTDRYINMSTIPPTNGVKLLERILRTADPEWMAEKFDTFYIFTTQIPWVLNDCKSILEFSRGGKTYVNLFSIAMGSTPAKEYIVPPDDNDWLKYLPMHVTDYSSWKSIAPLTLWWNDSPEQTFDLFSSGYLRYHADPPSFVYWILDIPSLVMKAVQYFRYGPAASLEKYIQTEVIAKITEQEERMWLFKLHQAAVKIQLGKLDLDDVLNYYKKRQTQFSYIGTKLDEALRDILSVYSAVQNGTLRVLGALNIPFLAGVSFHQAASFIPLRYNLSHLQQYQAMRLLRDIPLIDYLVSVYQLNPAEAITKQFKDRFRTLLFKWKSTIPLGSIRIEAQKKWIQEHLDSWTKFCMTQ